MNNDRLQKIEAQFETRSQRRDAEIGELREAFASLVTRAAHLESANVRYESELAARKPAGPLALWGPAIGTLVLVGSFGGYILRERVDPVVDAQKLFNDRQWMIWGASQYQKAQQECVEERLRDVERFGSRK